MTEPLDATAEVGASSPDETLWRNRLDPSFRFGLRRLFWITFLVALALVFVLNLPTMLRWIYRQWDVGQQFDQRTFEGPQFSVRITAFHQRGAIFAQGSIYQYEVRTTSDWLWRTIAMLHHYHDPEPIPADHLRRATDKCAYFFQGHIFGVTTDGGANWTIKGAPDYPPIVSGADAVNIEAITINPDGTGTMQVLVYENQNWSPGSELVTADFGQTWTEP